MGKLVGDGIKAAKDGIAYAKDAYNAGMDLYGDAMDKVAEIKDSKEYKAAMLSKEIAEKSKEMANIQKEKQTALQQIKSDIDVKQTQINGKIQAVQSNVGEAEKSYSQNADDAAASAVLSESEQSLDVYQDELQSYLDSKADETFDINEKYDALIKSKALEIAKLTEDLAKLSGALDETDDPEGAIKRAQEKFFTKSGETPTIAERQDLRPACFKNRYETTIQVYGMALEAQSEKIKRQEDVSSTTELSPTMPGQSENTGGVHTEILLKEADALKPVSYTHLTLPTKLEV